MRLSIIIVNYNTSILLKLCLQALYKSLTFSKLVDQNEVIIVDNNSSDNSVQFIEKEFPQVKLIQNKKNYGFAYANNQALRQAQGEYILLLNSDTEIYQDALKILIDSLEKDKSLGVVGGMLLNNDGTIQFSAGYQPHLSKIFYWMTLIDDIPYLTNLMKPYHINNKDFYKKNNDVEWVSGAFLLLRKDIIKKVGPLDAKIFMYVEEVEWCFRILKAGFKVRYISQAVSYHQKGASAFGKNSGIIEEFASLKYFYKKHKPFWQYGLLKIFLYIGVLLRMMLFGIIERDKKKALLYAKALQMVG